MKLFSIITILGSLFFFTKNQKPENVTLYNIECDNDCSYEYKVLKGEIFGFEFKRGRGTCCQWSLLNRTLFNEFYTIQFLNSYIYDYLSEQKKKRVGGTEFYYEIFKALHEANRPQTLKYIYTCCSEHIYNHYNKYKYILMFGDDLLHVKL